MHYFMSRNLPISLLTHFAEYACRNRFVVTRGTLRAMYAACLRSWYGESRT